MVGNVMVGSFESYFVNRTETTPIQFEGTYTADYVRKHVSEAVSAGYKAERLEGFARVIYEWHEDGRPWIYQEFYPIEQEVTV
jgi:hypothetical protein